METTSKRIQTEIAHVVFLDVVGFTRLPMEDQTRISGGLKSAIKSSPEYARAVENNYVYSLDTGDGAAIVFFGDPVVAAQFATELRQAATSMASGAELRIGINSGPVARTIDLTGRPNVTGTGINVAQRTMECAKPGQILLSETYAEFLSPFEEWSGLIRPISEFSTKHNAVLRLCELSLTPGRSVSPSSQGAQVKLEKHVRIIIIYKRNTKPDDDLLAFLEKEIAACGASIFIDRHLTVGVEWALEIEKQIRSADAVVALISAKAVDSEMLEYELRTALDELDKRGKPRILPIRVQFTDNVQGELGKLLDRFQYIVWNGPEDDELVLNSIIRSINESERPTKPEFVLEPPGGAMSPSSPFYVERPADLRFLEAIRRRDSIVLVKGARQMGKTSLLARGLGDTRKSGSRVVLTDFQVFNESQLENLETFYKSLMNQIAFQLRLRVNVDELWSPHLGPNLNLEQFIEDEILHKIPDSFVWAMDEVDRLFTRSYSSEVFGLIRSWHNRRQLDPSGPWAKLSLAIAYATEAHLFITDLHQSPFNVGTRLELSDFTIEQVDELNRKYGEVLKGIDELRAFYELVGGQPYLVRKGLDVLARGEMQFDELAAQANRDEGPFGDHLRRILVSILNAKGLDDAIRRILQTGACPDEESFYKLRTAGLVSGSSPASLHFRCSIYRSYLEHHLL